MGICAAPALTSPDVLIFMLELSVTYKSFAIHTSFFIHKLYANSRMNTLLRWVEFDTDVLVNTVRIG
jgi:hypothetical protein